MADSVQMYDSILVYAKWLNLRQMRGAVRATFDKMVKTDNQTSGMKNEGWNDLLTRATIDPTDAAQTDVYMSDEEWLKLYNEFRTTFRNLNASREDLKRSGQKDTINFLDMAYGPAGCFGPRKTDDTAVAAITNNIVNTPDPELKRFFTETLNKQFNVENPTEFLKDIAKKKYDSDKGTRDKLIRFVEYIKDFANNQLYYSNDIADDKADELRRKLVNFPADEIIQGLENEPDPKPEEMNAFKNAYYQPLLDILVQKDDVRKDFASAGGSKITTPIEAALGKTNYKDENSKDYVAPSEKDTLTPMQELEKTVKDHLDDTILKLENRAKYDKYLLPNLSKPIALAIYGAKWKPTDGLEKLVELKGKISGKFKGKQPHVAEAFDFLIKALEHAKNTTPKQFEGALKNGNQGLALDILIAEYDIREGKKDDIISAAHEVLSKLRWGYNTSVMRDKLFEKKIELFGDKGYSWNKNEFMAGVTGALDTTLHYTAKGIFNIFNAATNAIRRNGRFYKLNEAEQKRIDGMNKKHDDDIRIKESLRTQKQAELTQLESDAGTLRTDFRAWRARNGNYGRRARDAAQTRIDAYNDEIQRISKSDNYKQAQEEKNNLDAELQQKQAERQQLDQRKQQLDNEIQRLQAQETQLNQKRQTMRTQQRNMIQILRAARVSGDLGAQATANTNLQNLARQIAAIDNKLRDIPNQITQKNNEKNDIDTNQIPAKDTEITNI
ncbi:MAG: hypothetical protein J6K82_00980, partial [Alphaproteobacteria bacterium]|nr:hypothetical protein [Alphaproteobacteria bacterium]